MKFKYLFLLLLPLSQAYSQIKSNKILSDVKTFEVSASKPFKNDIITAWMEKRPSRKDNSEEAADMRIAYKASTNNGKDWTEKGIIDLPNTFATGNPFVTSSNKGETYLVCMHIGQDFFSGNISLYEYDFSKKIFNLKSIPITSKEKLLDKPSIVCNGDEIHLIYAAYTKNFKNTINYQMSKDKGLTWTDPVRVFNDQNVTYLGPAISVVDQNQIVISAGSYGRKNIYFTKKKQLADQIEFDSTSIVTRVSADLGSAMTELTTDGSKLLLTWQNSHQRNETWLSYSNDIGMSWSKPHLINSTGNLLSAAYDKNGNIHCIYSDFGDQKFFVGYKYLNSNYEVLKEDYLAQPAPLTTFTEYLGAYQKIIVQNNVVYAFWIDYPNNSTLNFTKWKIR